MDIVSNQTLIGRSIHDEICLIERVLFGRAMGGYCVTGLKLNDLRECVATGLSPEDMRKVVEKRNREQVSLN